MMKKRAQAATRWSIVTCIMTAGVASWAQPLPPPPGPAPALPPAGSEQTPRDQSPSRPSQTSPAVDPLAEPLPETSRPLPGESARSDAQQSPSEPMASESAEPRPRAPELSSTPARRQSEAAVGVSPQPNIAEGGAPAPLEAEVRQARLRQHSSLRGSTGLLRTHAAATGPTGTFRFGLLGSYFGASGFLCPQCVAPDGGPAYVEDDVSRAEAHVQISASIRPYIEAYFGLHSSATSNDRGDPELLQVLGDTTWGLKAFMPRVDDGLFTAGGAFELWLLNGSGGVGIGGASVALRGLASLDFNNHSDPRARIPLRVHGNLSYVFDNSSELIEDIEEARRERITRIERFGLNINRVDRLVPAIGVEGLFEYVHPFVEWSIDIPSNIFKDYGCVRRSIAASDICLTDRKSIAATPSRLTLGARGYALLEGLSALLAFDIGMGGVSAPFWEETRPEPPWNLWFGISYAVDTQPRVVVRTVREPAPPRAEPDLYGIRGYVVTEGEAAPIAGARVVFEGRGWNGFVTNARGSFQTPPLDPGTYTLLVEAEGYYTKTCPAIVDPQVLVSAEASVSNGIPTQLIPPAEGESQGDERTSTPVEEAWPAPTPGSVPGRLRWASVTCELKAKPQVGALAGSVVDAVTQDPVAGAQVSVIDALGRSLALLTNDNGAYRFENVIPGTVTIRVRAENYLPTAVVVEMKSGEEIASHIRLSRLPDESSFLVRDHDIVIKQPIVFQDRGVELGSEAVSLVDELALLMKQRPDISAVEIRVYASAESDLALSRERAARLRQALIDRGVEASRLGARGYEATPEQRRAAGGFGEQHLEIVRIEQ